MATMNDYWEVFVELRSRTSVPVLIYLAPILWSYCLSSMDTVICALNYLG
jgi:hypothetical protein